MSTAAKKTSRPPSSSSYHHGDLRSALITAAAELMQSEGVDGLSLRKLAERAGVSRSAPYHHFKDKNALLCALAESGFEQLETMMDGIDFSTPETGLRQFVRRYMKFATEQPERYELMFGRGIWQNGGATDSLAEVAYKSFRDYAQRVEQMLSGQSLPAGTEPLRLAQASWATLHGLSKLLNDGIYVNPEDMEAVSDQAVTLMLAGLKAK